MAEMRKLMHYYDPEDKRPVRWGAAAAAAYVLLLMLAFLLVTFDFTRKELPGQGLLIAFGTTDEASGAKDVQAADAARAPERETEAATAPEPEFVTVEQSDVMVRDRKPERETQRQSPAVSDPAPDDGTESGRQTVNRRALFPGRPAAPTPVWAGTPAGSGNAGAPAGSPDGSREGTGQADSGPSYDLSGRSVVGALPKPRYKADETGKVIVDVTVDAAGRVTTAAYRSQGSTTNNSELVAAAVEAALKARFSESETIVQGGTITYIFRMN